MKSSNAYAMSRIASYYGARPNLRPKLNPRTAFRPKLYCTAALNMKLYNKRFSFCLSYPRALHAVTQTGMYYDLCFYNEAMLLARKNKIGFERTKDCHINKTANDFDLDTKTKNEELLQASLFEIKDINLLKSEALFGKRFLDLVDPCFKVISTLSDDIHIKDFNKIDTPPIQERYPLKSPFSTTSLSTLTAAVSPQSDISKSSIKNILCNSCDGFSSIRNGPAGNTFLCRPSGKILPPGEEPEIKKYKPEDYGKPSNEKLDKIVDTLSADLPLLFAKTMNYSVYSLDLIFENRIRGTCTVGISSYIRQLSLLRVIGHLRFAFIKLDILKMTKHVEEGTVKVRWRIVGGTTLRSLPFLFTLKSYNMKSAKSKMDTWYDGLSTFYVNKDGFIYRHVVDDKMVNDEHLKEDRSAVSILARLAAVFGLHLRNAPANVSSASIKGSNIIMPDKPAILIASE